MGTPHSAKSHPYPDWVVMHLPHHATIVPPKVRDQFLLSNVDLAREIELMTDHLTDALFVGQMLTKDEVVNGVAASRVSRLVVDVERFADDEDEPMAQVGMGAIYTRTAFGLPLRRPISDSERELLLTQYFHPHHAQFEALVARALGRHNCCLVLDCHSFPASALPYELSRARIRPDICLGFESFHLRPEIARMFREVFEAEGWTVAYNEPFSGAAVPQRFWRKDPQVNALMVEVNKALYLVGDTCQPQSGFEDFAARLRRCLARGFERVAACGLYP